MRVALAINDRLSAHRNDQVAARLHLPQSSTFGVKSTKARFNAVRQDGLEGSALWYDYRMRSSERVLMEVLRSASALGARALNYAKAVALNSDHGAIRGIVVEDQVSGERFEVRANRVCNCIGSYTRAFSAEHDRDNAKLFTPSLAFNVLFSCAQLSDDALAVAAPEPRAPVYFLCPSPLGIWAGTEHVGRPDGCLDASVTEMELQDFMRRINAAIPSLQLSRDKVRRVCSGLLPVRSPSGTDLTAREVIVDHGRTGGLRGLYSVIGIKFTTVQTVAARAIDAMLGSSEDAAEAPRADDLRLSSATSELIDGERVLAMGEDRALEVIRDVATEEAALSSDDFILRRCNWTFTASDLARLQALADKALGPTKSTAGRLGILSSYG
jgi:glycerol-3-phosphate dehydrogenase